MTMSETTQSQMDAKVTSKAVEALTKALEGRELSSVGLRVSVHPGGCSGFQYGLSFEEDPADEEIEVVVDGVRLFVAEPTVPLLSGMEIDFVDTLMGGGFKINNPNATSACGCGKSFS
jgi:iron-sulfur cluster assembly accessory protein